mmetsp:Transcript_2385/g.2768  ORF Transcript_2385/g.2768 Transcript_2385/m.2768 type:complete len:242 (+) Transcript_2385:900-1625(+)
MSTFRLFSNSSILALSLALSSLESAKSFKRDWSSSMRFCMFALSSAFSLRMLSIFASYSAFVLLRSTADALSFSNSDFDSCNSMTNSSIFVCLSAASSDSALIPDLNFSLVAVISISFSEESLSCLLTVSSSSFFSSSKVFIFALDSPKLDLSAAISRSFASVCSSFNLDDSFSFSNCPWSSSLVVSNFSTDSCKGAILPSASSASPFCFNASASADSFALSKTSFASFKRCTDSCNSETD